MSGLRLAALYGLPPHQLGFCGPWNKKRVLLDYLKGGRIFKKQAEKILEDFEAAFPYYKLIARSNGIKNPFNRKVVKAYWLGNNLLARVKINDLKKMIAEDFSKPKQKISKNLKPHHSFHVLVIGSVTGRIKFDDRLRDLCRICWGKVKKISKNKKKIIIEYQPLLRKKKFFLGKAVKKEIAWKQDLTPKLKVGDWVSFHWDQIIEILGPEDLQNLKKYTQLILNNL